MKSLFSPGLLQKESDCLHHHLQVGDGAARINDRSAGLPSFIPGNATSHSRIPIYLAGVEVAEREAPGREVRG
jgi:hypothetical protein